MADSPALKIELEKVFTDNAKYFKGIKRIDFIEYDPEKTNSDIVFIGQQHTILNWRAFNISRLSIAYDVIESSPWADYNLRMINSIYDISVFSMAIIYAHLYADTVQPKEEAITNLKNMLGKYYSMTGDFTGHGDPEWIEGRTPVVTIYNMIDIIRAHAWNGN
jgi:hypothetical protein